MSSVFKAILFFSAIISFTGIYSQERAGLVLGQYNGVNALSLNPANSFNSANNWDVQLGGAHLFMQTNYGFVTQSNLFKLLKNHESVFIPERRSDIITHPDTMVMRFNENGNTRADLKAEILGPGFLFRFREKYTLGLSTKFRSLTQSFNIPHLANFYVAQNLEIDSIYNFPSSIASAIAWPEINLHFGVAINESLNLGVTAKYLGSYFSTYGQIDSDFDFSQFAQDEYDIVSGGSFTIAYPENVEAGPPGIGLDLGVTIKDVFQENSTLGLSILDVGIVKNKGEKITYLFDTDLVLDSENYSSIDDLDSLKQQLAQDFEIEAGSVQNGYYTALPAAIAIQYSFFAAQNVSVSSYWVQRLPLPTAQKSFRANSINLTGHYDKKHFSAFLPVTLYEYSDLRIGLAIRLGPLTIGSDKVLSLFGERDFNGTDLYANLQVYPFQLWDRKNRTSNKGVQCYW